MDAARGEAGSYLSIVDVRVEGTPAALPAALDLSAYRIIQEGLTNTLKHAQASHADVVIQYRTDTLEIAVRDDGRGAWPATARGTAWSERASG